MSPASWPKVSLNLLKWSRSRKRTAIDCFFASCQLQFSFERFLQEAPVEQVSQRITNRLFTKGFAQLQAGQRKRDL